MNRLLIFLLLVLLGGGCKKQSVDPTIACQLTATIDNETWTYQFNAAGRVKHIVRHTPSNDLDYAYTYRGNQATIDLTYTGVTTLRFRNTLILNEQGYVLTARDTMYTTLSTGVVESNLRYSHVCTYDAQGYLTTHHVDSYVYPSGTASKKLSQTTDARLSYQDGNPVMISYSDQEGTSTRASTTTNQYGTQPNPLKMSFLLEANGFGYAPDRVLQPLLGKPPRTLITTSSLTGATTMTVTYTYKTNTSGQLVQVGRGSGPGINAPFSFSFDNICP